jgi:mannose-6-phosphate isomerase-like protein (cupin superfamily)
MLIRTLIVAGFSAGLSALATYSLCGAAGAAGTRMASKVMKWEDAEVAKEKWGDFRKLFTGEAAGIKDVLTAFAVLKPGEEIHRPHRHAEEEILVITEGSGTWSLDGKEFPLKKGDVLYVEPWVSHGCTNTGKEPMTFFVVKWNGKGIPVPAEPPGKESAK